MSGTTLTSGSQALRRERWLWVGEGLTAAVRGLAFFGLMLVGAVLLAGLVLSLVLLRTWMQPQGGGKGGLRLILVILLLPGCLLAVRWLAGLTRSLSGRWCRVPIAVPYRALPDTVGLGRWLALRRRARWLLTDPATWRDLLWAAADVCGGFVLAVAPAGLVAYGLGAMVLPALGLPIAHGPWLGSLAAWLAIPLGLGIAAAGLWAAPPLLTAYGSYARSMLGPTRQAELSRQVQHLAQTRSDTLDSGAAQIRRIERDLHDGAQARLVAMGMTLDAAEQLLDTSPDAARALLAEARASSVKALAELRDLVRGIHPPVLADRGLADAVRALALDLPLQVHFAAELPGRPPAPVETAAYFAASELLANVSKHSGADQAWIDIRYSGGMLRISVTDDGRGGAEPDHGTGLRGIERRLGGFDGVLAVASPPGGPTVVNMEIPCELSSPKTCSC
jgi:signal transduction histidine kinase